MTAQPKFIADRRYIHVDGSLYAQEDADKGGLASTPTFKGAVILGVFASAAFAMTQPGPVRAVVFVGGLAYTTLIAWSSVARFRTLVYRTIDPWAPRILDKSGQGWSDPDAAIRLRERYHELTAKGFSTAVLKLALGTFAGFATGFPEAGLALATVGGGGDLLTACWSIHADVMLARGNWCVLKRRPRLRLKTTTANAMR